MTLVKFNRKPFETGLDSFFNDFMTDLPTLFKNGNGNGPWKGFAPVNIKESEKNYRIEVVAPGFDKVDFKVNLDQDVLTISAEKKSEKTEENKPNEKEIRKEYRYQSFKRSFTIDE